jgi:hypothetical protein
VTLTIVDIEAPQPKDDVPRDGYGRPMIVPRSGGKPLAHSRISSYGDAIDDKTNLDVYHQRMVLVGAALKPSLLEVVPDLSLDDPADTKKLNALALRAMDVAGANKKSGKGTDLHSLSELVDQGLPLPQEISPADMADMAAYSVAMMDFDVLDVELFVVCEELTTAGTLDRRARYIGFGPDEKLMQLPLIVDLKTGSVEYGALKMACQLSMYAKGWRYDFTRFPAPDREADKKGWEKWKKTEFSAEEAAEAYTPLGDVDQKWGVIVNVPSGTGEASLHWADLELGWEAALMAKEIREMRSRGKKALAKFAA